MKKIKKHVERLTLPVEYKNKSEILNSAILAFLISIVLFMASIVFYLSNLFRASYVLFVGGLIYELLLIFSLFHLTKRQILKIESINFKKTASFLGKIVFGLIFLTLFTLILINQPVEKEVNKLSLLLALFIILIFVVSWKNMFSTLKKFNKRWLILPILFLLIIPMVAAQNDTLAQGIQTAKKGVSFVEQTYKTIINVTSFFSNLTFTLASLLNISEGASSLVTIIIVLAIIFVILQFIKLITKWAIVLLVIWVVLQFLGFV